MTNSTKVELSYLYKTALILEKEKVLSEGFSDNLEENISAEEFLEMLNKSKIDRSLLREENTMRNNEKLKPCPFCDNEVFIGISDDEGNPRDEEYEDDPWSGLSFRLIHEYQDDIVCPIATHYDEILGALLYESREEATKIWNNRK